jgi:hypothetical protein
MKHAEGIGKARPGSKLHGDKIATQNCFGNRSLFFLLRNVFLHISDHTESYFSALGLEAKALEGICEPMHKSQTIHTAAD